MRAVGPAHLQYILRLHISIFVPVLLFRRVILYSCLVVANSLVVFCRFPIVFVPGRVMHQTCPKMSKIAAKVSSPVSETSRCDRLTPGSRPLDTLAQVPSSREPGIPQQIESSAFAPSSRHYGRASVQLPTSILRISALHWHLETWTEVGHGSFLKHPIFQGWSM